MVTLFFPSITELRDFRMAIQKVAVFISFEDLSVTGNFSEAELELAIRGMKALVQLEIAN